MKSSLRLRYIILGAFTGAIMLFFIVEMMILQLAHGADYAGQAAAGISIPQIVTAARGEIVDRNGASFTGNSTVYNITVDSSYIGSETAMNALLLELCDLCEAFGCEWLDQLPITTAAPYTFTEESDAAQKTLRAKLSLSQNATADDVLYWLRDLYHLNDYTDHDVLDHLRSRNGIESLSDAEALDWLRGFRKTPDATDEELIASLRENYKMYRYTESESRRLAGIRYSMVLEEFSANNPYTFASDVTPELLACIKERGSALPGVDVIAAPVREILTGDLACHLLGVTGSLTAEDYTSLKENGQTYSARNPSGYRISDIIGRSGIEQAFEEELRGQNGLRTVLQDQQGNVIGVEETVKAVPGHTIQLTIDQSVQAAAQKAVADRIAFLNKNAPVMKGREAEAGAAVAIQVKTGAVLALASYPDFDLSQYYSLYNELSAQKPSPLFNRATQGLYTVGSTYKPSVAIAALDTGTITPADRVTCTGKYTFYHDYQPLCEGVHGAASVVDALRVSCNVFFYDMGRRMGIEAINKYSYALGLGHTTGIEIPESAGQLSSPETRAAIGEDWYESYDIQSAIGQLDNQFTILQMASYAATLANRGQRMQVHLVDKVWDYSMENVLYEAVPTVVDTVECDPIVWDTVREGMIRSCYNDSRGRGTSYATWGNLRGKTWSQYGVNITVAGKTGSPQVANGLVNSVFICYAPAEDPEIAVAVIIEKGYEGDRAAPVAKAILEEYFFGENGVYREKAIAARLAAELAASRDHVTTIPEERQPA